MPLIYAAVARGAAVLAEYAVFAGNFGAVARDYLAKAAAAGSAAGGGGAAGGAARQAADGRFAYTVDGHVFSFLANDGFCYVVVTDEAAGRTIPNAFLDRVRADFVARFGADKARAAKEGGLSSFARTLKELMEHATQYPEQYSKVAAVQKRVDEVKQVMSDNIEKVLSRGEKLDLLVDKTDNLMSEADRFLKSGRALRRKMWLANVKMRVALALVVVMVAVILFLLICFGGGRSCVRKKAAAAAKAAGAEAASSSPSPSPSVGGGSARRLLLEAALQLSIGGGGGGGGLVATAD